MAPYFNLVEAQGLANDLASSFPTLNTTVRELEDGTAVVHVADGEWFAETSDPALLDWLDQQATTRRDAKAAGTV